MSFGYLGDTSTKIKQVKKNDGILTPSDVVDLQSKGHLGGSLELIESQTHSTNVTAVDFTSIKESAYSVHFLTFENVVFDTANVPALRFRESGTWEDSAGYYTMENWLSTAGESEVRETDHSFIFLGNDTLGETNGSVYIYGAGNSATYTFTTHNHIDWDASRFVRTYGGASLAQTSLVNGIRFCGSGGANLTAFTINLYGLKEV